MTTATIENDPISIQLDNSTITVPSNEVWKVTIVGAALASGFSGNNQCECLINGNKIASSITRANTGGTNAGTSAETTLPFETVVIDGDTIEHNGSDALNISGFVVNDNYTP